MAVQKLNNKKITKFDTSNPNFKMDKIKEEKVISGNSIENKSNGVYQSDGVYGEKMENMMKKMMGKIDNIRVGNTDIYGQNKNGAVDVDIKRNIFLAKPDKANIKIDNVTKGKVNNKLDKLRKLRKR